METSLKQDSWYDNPQGAIMQSYVPKDPERLNYVHVQKSTSLSLSGKNDVSTSGFFPGFFFFSGTTTKGKKTNIILEERVTH